MRVRTFTDRRRTDPHPNQSQDTVDGCENLVCGGGPHYASAQDVDPVVEELGFGLACACCHRNKRSSRTTGVELKGVWVVRREDCICAYQSVGGRLPGPEAGSQPGAMRTGLLIDQGTL